MSTLTRDDVQYLARLARLDLSDEEVESLLKELPTILDYVDKLQEVDTSNLEPTKQVVDQINVMRPDTIIQYGYDPKELLENVPDVKEDQIKVKRMV